MMPARIENAEPNSLRPPTDWDEATMGRCVPLPIRIERHADGLQFMVSAWQPSPGDLAAIHAGASIHLGISGSVHPVVSMRTGPVPNDAPAPRPGFTFSEELDDDGKLWCRAILVIGGNHFNAGREMKSRADWPASTAGLSAAMLNYAEKQGWL